jgi:hypothetical protein
MCVFISLITAGSHRDKYKEMIVISSIIKYS